MKRANTSAGQSGKGLDTDVRARCHVVSNTHWDREWRFSMQKVRHRLVGMLDQLFEILERNPGYHSFHLDSQTVPVQDYLEIRPERRDLVARLVREGRLFVGPWFCLPDENCVGGEALIRNLLLGHTMAEELGHVSKTGYSPFSWGQISQMPQIYKGFGIDFAAFYRGINTRIAEKSEFIWEGADGTQIVASRLGRRPRYNVYYIVQRAAYWGVDAIDEKHEHWTNGHGPWRMASPAYGDSDYDYLHPGFEYHSDMVPDKARQAMCEQDDDWATQHRFWSIGHDASFPDIREVRMIKDCASALEDQADVFHGSVEEFQRSVLASVGDDLPVIRGEMRHPRTDKDYSALLGWVTSARMYIKQANFEAERNLVCYAEPLGFFAHLLGAPFPGGFLQNAYNWLLQNHGHDSIGGCSRDVIHEDMLYRYRQVNEISRCVIEDAMLNVCRGIDLSDWSAEDVALVAYNPCSATRSRVQTCLIDLPEHWRGQPFDLVDDDGNVLPSQVQHVQDEYWGLLNPQGDVPTTILSDRYRMHVHWPDVPGFGYRTFRLATPREAAVKDAGLVSGPDSMENEHIAVQIKANGSLKIVHKSSGRTYDNQGYFRDTSEAGNPWEHEPVDGDIPLTTREAHARITMLEDGPVTAAFRVEIDWSIPAGLTDCLTRRSEETVLLRIINTVRLSRGERWVTVETDVDNTAKNHYLQVCFPSRIQTDRVWVQTPFDVVERGCCWPEADTYAEVPQNEHPMDSFLDRSDGIHGLALLNEGLKAYQAEDDEESTVSVSLLRCFSLRIWQTWKMSDYSEWDPGSQCPGRHRFRYAVMPHTGDWEDAGLWQAAQDFNMELALAQMSPSGSGPLPRCHSFLDVSPESVQVSAVKKAEKGDGWVIRLFNPGREHKKARVKVNGGMGPPRNVPSPIERMQWSYRLNDLDACPWREARILTLEEKPEMQLDIAHDGTVEVSLGPRQIKTLEWVP